ncbi:transcriptional regulator [Oecophyllibacter saccharovorans]|uniref:Transcriptional regulator n=1 Tax=Oecophyllibacter saccharovorans TaxID=2558360 RepID=A0A506UQD1_9PROT|nr:transcriptional regulator [Oecophyllibacter saccharovorans]TPW35591.1 transcriptional regulator [Oecophyllibacter saccharovorans]
MPGSPVTVSADPASALPARRRRHPYPAPSPACAVEATLSLIDGKWKGAVLWHLLGGTLRFGELRRRMPRVTQRILTNQLRELEADGLVLREVFPVVPLRVEYSLTPLGKSLGKVLTLLKEWGDDHESYWKKATQQQSLEPRSAETLQAPRSVRSC